ncbi:MAG: type II toxin-antitoxin system HicB family antitoxin [Chloroflexi bacterium]|nr:type II toxin-antitoxin system HicB family antitoxin [Chloroflexota bacterium]
MSARAKALSSRTYSTVIRYEQDAEGFTGFFADHPELFGCMAQGATAQEAEANLATAREEMIEYLLENNLPVPDPAPMPGAFVVAQAGGPINQSVWVVPSMQLHHA